MNILERIKPLPLDKHAQFRYNLCMTRVEQWRDMALAAQAQGKFRLADVGYRAAYAYMKSVIFWESKL